MIDFGLMLSMVAVILTPTLMGRWWPLRRYPSTDPSVQARNEETVGAAPAPQLVSFLDLIIVPVLVGVLVGRLFTLAIEDPSSLTAVANIMIIRSGVEFWPGLVAGTATLAFSLHREASLSRGATSLSPRSRSVVVSLAATGPLALIAYAGYEATCVFRDGCFGPVSPIGLRPRGLATTMLPVGWLVALAVVAVAFSIQRRNAAAPALSESSARSPQAHARSPQVHAHSPQAQAIITMLYGVGAVAVIRSVASFWLPHTGGGVTRQHATSIGVAAATGIVLVVMLMLRVGDKATRPEESNEA